MDNVINSGKLSYILLIMLLKYYVFSLYSKLIYFIIDNCLVAGSLEAAYSLNWGAQKIWGKGGGKTLALL